MNRIQEISNEITALLQSGDNSTESAIKWAKLQDERSGLESLKRAADFAFINGFSSTHFMREISNHDACKITLQCPIMDCYNPQQEPELLSLIETLGYSHSSFGFIRL